MATNQKRVTGAVREWASAEGADILRHDPRSVFEAGERNHHISNTSYPIAHSSVWKPYRVPRERHEATVRSAFERLGTVNLYTHIPFCETRCYYCEYTVVGRDELDEARNYMSYLGRELARYRDLLDTRSMILDGFDIGGGTPSFVDAELIAEHIQDVRSSFNCRADLEISIETTPKIASEQPAKLAAYVSSGVKRISMGIQVTQPDLLRILNRDENGLEPQFRAVENIRAAGFEKFNVDLMYGFADQTLESWRATLNHAIALEPEYITLYRMRYKLTRISDQAPRVVLGEVREQAAVAKHVLADAGYVANPGKNTFSRRIGDVGTSDYLTRRVIHGAPYLGIGLGAQTFSHTTISYNDGAAAKNLAPYFRSLDSGALPIQDLYSLPLEHMAAKMCAVSFYFGEVDLESFAAKFGRSFESFYAPQVEFVLGEGLMHYTGGSTGVKRLVRSAPALSLTSKGAEHFNGVIALFFAPSVQEYLLHRDPDRAEDFSRNRSTALRVYGEAPFTGARSVNQKHSG